MRSFAPSTGVVCCGLLLLGSTVQAQVSPSEDEKSTRGYEQGPLTFDDFQGKPPDRSQSLSGKRPLVYTATECRYTYRCKFEQVGNQVRATLTECEFVAVLLPSQSWIVVRDDLRLLDHEQGHFDITQAIAMRGQALFARQFRDGRPLTVSAPTKAAAGQLLEAKLKEVSLPLMDELYELHRVYDAETKNGTVPDQQAEHRRRQKQQLAEAARTLEELRDEPPTKDANRRPPQ